MPSCFVAQLGFYPVATVLDRVCERFLISIHRVRLRDLNFQMTAIDAKKGFGFEMISKAANRDHLQDETVLIPILACIFINVLGTAF